MSQVSFRDVELVTNSDTHTRSLGDPHEALVLRAGGMSTDPMQVNRRARKQKQHLDGLSIRLHHLEMIALSALECARRICGL